MTLPPLGSAFTATRMSLQLIGVHVMSRARHAATGRIDLTVTPGGIGTLAFGPDHRVLRADGPNFIIETTGEHPSTCHMRLTTASLRSLAAFADASLEGEFSAGHDAPPLGDIDASLDIDGDAVRVLGDWYGFGLQVIDSVLATLDPSAAPSRARLWPEHFDLGIDVGTATEVRVNLGASPGDATEPLPYVYVSPWTDDRPGEPDYWNASFGAVMTYAHLSGAPNPRAAAAAFMLEGLGRFEP